MMSRNSAFITLLAVYSVAILCGVFEYFSGTGEPRHESDIFADPTRNFPAVMQSLYPERPETEYLLGRRLEAMASRKLERGEIPLPEAIRELNRGLREASRYYERAKDLGLKSEEGLYYNDALVLMRLQADPKRIERAIADWHRQFPYSVRRDLNARWQSIEEQLQKLSSATNGKNASVDLTVDSRSETAAALKMVPEFRTNPEYVGSEACKKCHSKEFDSFQETNHAQTLTEVRPEDEPPDATFEHVASGRRYRIHRRDGALMIDESLPLKDGTEFSLTSTQVRYRVGSGHFARTYLRDFGNGFFFESPVTWYESTRAWRMTPGFDRPNHRSFSRQILENCLQCHSGQVCRSTESSFRLSIVENSIGCERCHGPGRSHVRLRESEMTNAPTNDPIVNPRRLSRKLAESICRQCHLQSDIQVEGDHIRAGDYRPGDVLEKFVTVYRYRKPNEGITVVGHVEQLSESPCYQKSEKLTCTSCHKPHGTIDPKQRVEHYRSACIGCHSNQGCKLDFSTRQAKFDNNCVSCHMPKSQTEVPHLAFTHHRIGIHPLRDRSERFTGDESLIPLSDLSGLSDRERSRSLKLAKLQMLLMKGEDFIASQRGQELVAEIDQWLNNLPADQVDGQTVFLKSQFLLARGDQEGAVATTLQLLSRDDVRSEEEAAVREQLGKIEFQRGRFEKARTQFSTLVRLRCQAQDWFYLGLCEDRSGHTADAVRAFERARELQPDGIEIYEQLAKIHFRGQNISEVGRLRREIVRLKGSHVGEIPNIGLP